MRSRLSLPRANISALTLLNAYVGVSPAALAASDPVAPVDIGDAQKSPKLMLGVGVGYARHWGQSYDVDVVSGASAPPVNGSQYGENGVAINAFADFAAVDLGHGNLGLLTEVTLAVPKTFMNLALEPRYRFRFPLMNTTVRSVEPWVGLGIAFAFREKIDKDYYLWLPLVAGCDFGFGSKRLYAGFAVEFNTINPKGVTRTQTVSGERRDYDAHMNNLATYLRLSYRVF